MQRVAVQAGPKVVTPASEVWGTMAPDAAAQKAVHQYIERHSRQVLDEKLFGDRIVAFLYSKAREEASVLMRLLTSARLSSLLGFLSFDMPLARNLSGSTRFLRSCGVDLTECLWPPEAFRTPRQIFERQIRYWMCRPMPEEAGVIVSPADSRMVAGSFADASLVRLKGKFFELEELLQKKAWSDVFAKGDWAVFRLTPEQYHYNHLPVSGRVADIYMCSGVYHSCNPSAVIEWATPFSKNRRLVTILDTDVPGGSGVGLVAMVEVVALMIGDLRQCYSKRYYDDPQRLEVGMFVDRGQPKSLFRPGSSTDVLIFEPGRLELDPDLIANQRRGDVASRFSSAFGRPWVETEVRVRSRIGRALPRRALV